MPEVSRSDFFFPQTDGKLKQLGCNAALSCCHTPPALALHFVGNQKNEFEKKTEICL